MARLFIVTTVLEENAKEVTYIWLRKSRKQPVAPYRELIDGYDRKDPEERSRLENRINEFLTQEEVKALRAYLIEKRGLEISVRELPLPAEAHRIKLRNLMNIAADVSFDVHELKKEEDDALPFSLKAVCTIESRSADLERESAPQD